VQFTPAKPSRRRRAGGDVRRRACSCVAKPGPKGPVGYAEVTDKAIFELHCVVGGGMFGRQGKGSGETCRACASPAGVRARIVPLGSGPNGS
jgi:hypothetical protein